MTTRCSQAVQPLLERLALHQGLGQGHIVSSRVMISFPPIACRADPADFRNPQGLVLIPDRFAARAVQFDQRLAGDEDDLTQPAAQRLQRQIAHHLDPAHAGRVVQQVQLQAEVAEAILAEVEDHLVAHNQL